MNSTDIASLFSLQDKTAVVTGGAGHLGSEISHVLCELGGHVVIASRDEEKCRREANSLSQRDNTTGQCTGMHLDVEDHESVRSFKNRVHDEIGPIDILVNNAWHGKKNTWESISYDDWESDLDISLNSVFRMTKAFVDDLKAQEGVILNIGSMYGHTAPDRRLYEGAETANPPSYGAAKAGVIQFTRYLASFLSAYNIRANCISPGPFPFPETEDQHPEFIDRIEQKNPMGRIGEPHEIKGAVALLCSDASSYMTGQNVCVDGGWAVW